jgi:carbon-monoxide dehydrogenase iron sulfur subunit
MQQRKILRAFKELCTGCRICEIVCSLRHAGKINPYLTRVKVVHATNGHSTFPIICHHCKNPPCKEECPIPNAMYTDEKMGIVMVNEDRCIQCFACVDACPFGAIQVGPDKEILKCDLCEGDPKCARYCPSIPGGRYPTLPLKTQSCLQYIEPIDFSKNKKSMLAKRG